MLSLIEIATQELEDLEIFSGVPVSAVGRSPRGFWHCITIAGPQFDVISGPAGEGEKPELVVRIVMN